MTLTDSQLAKAITDVEFFSSRDDAERFIGLDMLNITDTLKAAGKDSALIEALSTYPEDPKKVRHFLRLVKAAAT